jgi:hypothetical protein
MKNHRIKVYTPATGQTHRELVRTAGNEHGDIVLTFAEGDGLQFTPKPGDAEAAVPTVESVTRCCQNKRPGISTLWAGGAVLWGDVQAVAPTPAPTPTAKSKPPRQAVSQADAAQIVGVTDRMIRAWEKGRGTPEGWPSRRDAVALKAFADCRTQQGKLKRALANTQRRGDMSRYAAPRRDDPDEETED